MLNQPMLDDREWALIVELLRAERNELPVEIHHSKARQYHHELIDRLHLIDKLLEKLQGPMAAAG